MGCCKGYERLKVHPKMIFSLQPGKEVYLNQCQKRCKCDPGQGLTCDSHTCANGTQCLLRDGVMACYHQGLSFSLHQMLSCFLCILFKV